MGEQAFYFRTGLRSQWIRYRHQGLRSGERYVRAGVAGAYLPPVRLNVPHEVQTRVGDSLSCCAVMVARAYGIEIGGDAIHRLLQDSEAQEPSPRVLPRLGAIGLRVEYPEELQFFRDGTLELNRRLAPQGLRAGPQLVYRWEERWLRLLRAALREGVPPILFVDLGRLTTGWRGLRQAHAVVLVGGDGRQAWINDPARAGGPCRVGLTTLMDALLPGEPLAALLRPGWRESPQIGKNVHYAP
jgi:hypothetical protein